MKNSNSSISNRKSLSTLLLPHFDESVLPELDSSKLNYPSAMDWMWDYCIYLGGWEDENGNKYDLGIHIEELDSDYYNFSAAVVAGNEPGRYFSGDLDIDQGRELRPIYIETRKRAIDLNLISNNRIKLN